MALFFLEHGCHSYLTTPIPLLGNNHTNLYGQLGDPTMDLLTDPRANQNLVEGLNAFGLAARAQAAPLDASTASEADLLNFCKGAHEAFGGLYNAVPLDLAGDEKRKTTVEEKAIKGGDGQDMKLFIFRPEGKSGTLPCILYIHGGGMMTIPTDNKMHRMWCHDMATSGDGAVVIMVDFRNCYDDANHKFRPFPTGLNDCVAATEWIASHKSELGISNFVLQGESGGANLSIATALKLKQDGKTGTIDGVCAMCPYISGAYDWPEEKLKKELPSLVDNNGYFIERTGMALYVKAYDQTGKIRQNPLAWPYHANVEDLKGLPPFLVNVDELDPLRDEGMAFARKLNKAGVPVAASMNLGTTHGGTFFRKAIPEQRFALMDQISGFLRRL